MRSFGATSKAVRKFLLSTTAVLALSAGDAAAHTVSIGYSFAGPGAVNLWYGSYHNTATFNEANVQLVGTAYYALVNFNLITATKPAGLIDGVTNFYSNTAGTALVGVPQQVASTDGSGGAFNPATQSILHWQGATFTGLRPGVYTFTYNPLALPTVEWHPINSIIESNTFTLTAFDILGIPGYRFFGTNVNQRSVATGLDNAIGAGGYNQAIYNIAALPPAAMANALTQLSGEHATAAARASFQSLNAFMALTLDPWAAATRCGPQGPSADFGPAAYRQAIPQKQEPNDRPCSSNEWSVWASAYGGTNTTRGDFTTIGSHNTTINTGGMAVGVDYRPMYGTVMGVAMSAGSNSWNLVDGLGGAKTDTFQAAAYASTRFDAMYLSAAVAFGNSRTTQDRTVTIFTSDAFTAKYNTNTIGTRIETGYRLNTADVGVTPYAAIQAQYFRSPNYSETPTYGAPDYALDFSARKATQARFEAGSWFDFRIPIDATATLSTRARAAWIYDMQSTTQIAASFQSLPGSNFTVLGATPVTNAALVSAAAELKLRTGFSLSAKFDSEIGSRSTTLIGTGTLRYQW